MLCCILLSGNVFVCYNLFFLALSGHFCECVWLIANLSQARYELSSTSVGNIALFAGGQVGYHDFGSLENIKYFDTVDIYHASDNSWSTTKLSQARFDMAATTIGNNLA